MSKKQKIWFAVFLAMFAVPEALWLIGMRGNIDIPWFPINDLAQFKSILVVYFTTLIPFIGLLGLSKIIAKLQINRKIKMLFFFALVPLTCWFGFLALTLIWVMIYYMNGTPQIG